LQALSHYRALIPPSAKAGLTLACGYPEPDGEILNQSRSIIGAREAVGNDSEGS
jgi:hypothetical protein